MAKLKRMSIKKTMGERTLAATPRVRYLLQVGCLFDLYTGKIVSSTETDDNGVRLKIVNGGIPFTTGILGRPNRGKSTLKNFLMHTAFSRMYRTADIELNSYDTEGTVDVDRQVELAARNYPGYGGEDIVANGLWNITDKEQTSGTAWFKDYRSRMKEKGKKLRHLVMTTLVYDKFTKKGLEVPMATGDDVDSISEFDTEATEKQLASADLGSMDAQTVYMNLGLQRTNMIKELPRLSSKVGNYIFITAHVDDKIEMAAGPGKAPKQKQLQTLRPNDAPKGLPSKAFFLLHIIFQVIESTPFVKPDTRTPMLPLDAHDNKTPSKDLVKMNIAIIRSKICDDGREFILLSSKKYGIQPTLSEYYYIKYTLKDFGISGSGQSLFLDIYPEVTFSRTTIRAKIDSDPLLRRAIQITSDLAQMEERMYDLVKDVLISPKDLYTQVKAKGYDWPKLYLTRNWQVPNDGLIETPVLISYDMLRIAKGTISLKKYKKSSSEKSPDKKPIQE